MTGTGLLAAQEATVTRGRHLSPVLFTSENIPRETLRDHHTCFHRWKADVEPTICRRHLSRSRHQQEASRPDQQTDRLTDTPTARATESSTRQSVTGNNDVEAGVRLVQVNTFNDMALSVSPKYPTPSLHRSPVSAPVSCCSLCVWGGEPYTAG